jgi:hypothetical protein
MLLLLLLQSVEKKQESDAKGQLNDYLIIEMNDHIESAAIHLTQLKQGTGKYCRQFSVKFNVKG